MDIDDLVDNKERVIAGVTRDENGEINGLEFANGEEVPMDKLEDYHKTHGDFIPSPLLQTNLMQIQNFIDEIGQITIGGDE